MYDAEAKAHLHHKRFNQRPWKHDARSRRFSHHRFFGTLQPHQFPKTLDREIGPIYDQGPTLRCTGYGNAFEGYLIHGIPMNPDWSAHKIGQKQGRSVDINGGDPNACMKSQRDDGYLPLTASDRSWRAYGIRDTDMNKWDTKLDEIAKKYDRAVGFFRVDGPFDTFDNIKSAIIKEFDPKTGRGQGVDAFGTWYHDWSTAPRGVVPTDYSIFAGYHRYVFFDFCAIGNKEYLKAKNSYGSSGDNSIYYFPREVVNREFAKRGTTLKILKTLTPEQLAEAKKQTPLGRLWEQVIQIWYDLSEHFGIFAYA